jgi:hypothetical protein
MLPLLIVIGSFVSLAFIGPRYGVDSRGDHDRRLGR